MIYFYIVYGQRQISEGDMASVIEVFENQYKQKKALTIVRPGTKKKDLLMLMKQLEFVGKFGKVIKTYTTAFYRKNHFR